MAKKKTSAKGKKKPMKKAAKKPVQKKAMKKNVAKTAPKKKAVKKKAAKKPVRKTAKKKVVKTSPAKKLAVAPEIEKFYKEEERLMETPELEGPNKPLTAMQPTYNPEQKPAKHDAWAINGLILAILGVIIPILSLVGLYLGILSAKEGSKIGKGTIILSIATFILNLYIMSRLFG